MKIYNNSTNIRLEI